MIRADVDRAMAARIALGISAVGPQRAGAALRGKKAEIRALAIALVILARADHAVGAGAARPVRADAKVGWGEARQVRAAGLRDARQHAALALRERIDLRAGLAMPTRLIHD